jgi:hypothetical protein
MPRTRSRISTAETREDRDRLLRLERIGVATGDAGNLSSKPNRFILEQIDPELARVYDLPSGCLAVVGPALLTILEPGVMIFDRLMTATSNEGECVFDLSDPREHEHPSLLNLTEGLYNQSTILHDFLAGQSVRFRRCQIKGVILATGWMSDPATHCEERFLTMELALRDEQGNESYREFRAEVDGSIRQRYERQQRERRLATPMGKPEGLYGTKIRAGDQISIPPKPSVGSESDASSDFQPSRSGRSIPAAKEKYRSKIQ